MAAPPTLEQAHREIEAYWAEREKQAKLSLADALAELKAEMSKVIEREFGELKATIKQMMKPPARRSAEA
jgi:hypothetical protein